MSRIVASIAAQGGVRPPVPILGRAGACSLGPVTRLMSPQDLGESLKPFVLLELVDTRRWSYSGSPLHPHSGVAVLTHLFEGGLRFEDSEGPGGELRHGGAAWFCAGAGGWHGAVPMDDGPILGVRLWIALPPEAELGPASSLYVPACDLPRDGPARVLLGAGVKGQSPIHTPSPVDCLSVRLRKGQSWRWRPPAGDRVAFIAVARGRIVAAQPVGAGELVAIAPSEDPIDLLATCDAQFLLGSAPGHPFPLVRGCCSVHTTPSALAQGEWRMAAVAERLAEQGRL